MVPQLLALKTTRQSGKKSATVMTHGLKVTCVIALWVDKNLHVVSSNPHQLQNLEQT
jgi:hypothetical protein